MFTSVKKVVINALRSHLDYRLKLVGIVSIQGINYEEFFSVRYNTILECPLPGEPIARFKFVLKLSKSHAIEILLFLKSWTTIGTISLSTLT